MMQIFPSLNAVAESFARYHEPASPALLIPSPFSFSFAVKMELKILSPSISPFCPTWADVEQYDLQRYGRVPDAIDGPVRLHHVNRLCLHGVADPRDLMKVYQGRMRDALREMWK
jgi:hypothetical protein